MYYTAQANMGYKAAREVIPAAIALEQKALGVDPFIPEAHALLGVCIGSFEHDWNRAEQHLAIGDVSRACLARRPFLIRESSPFGGGPDVRSY
jgi:hypothetical protein